MNKIKSSFFLISLGTLVLGCDIQKIQRTQHEGAVEEKPVLQPDAPATSEDFKKINLNEMHASLTSALKIQGAQNQQISAQTAEKLSGIVLNNNYIQNPVYLAKPELRTMLSYFNISLQELIKAKSPEADKYLPIFYAAVSKGCDENLKGCENFGFFKTDHRSAQFVVLYLSTFDGQINSEKDPSKKLAAVKKYYDALAIAIELKNGQRDQELEFLYLKRAREYADYFKSEKYASLDKELFRRHGTIFENIVRDYPADQKSPRFKEFVKNFKPWTYSRLETDPFPFGTERMFSFAAANYLYEDPAKKQLSTDLKAAIAEIRIKEDKLGRTFWQRIQDIEADTKLKNFLPDLHIDADAAKSDSFYDEYFYMIDRLYRGHLEPQEVGQIWRGSNKDTKLLISRLKIYMQIEMAEKIVRTNNYISKVVQDKDMNAESLIRQTLVRSREISDKWTDMLAGFENRLGVFLATELRNSKVSEDALEEAKDIIKSVRPGIKYNSVYPLQFILAYYAQDLEASLVVDTFWGPVQIPSSDIIESLFKGRIPPWFSFGNDQFPLNKKELLYAYYFSLTTGTFETFADLKGNKDISPVDRKLFFQKVVRQYLAVDMKNLKTSLDSMRSNKERVDYINLVNSCERLNAGDKNFSTTIELGDLVRFTTFGTPNLEPMSILLDVYKKSNGGPDKVFKNIRATADRIDTPAEGLETKLIFVDTMVNILKKSMENSKKFTQAEIDDISKISAAEKEKVQQLADDYHAEVLAQHRQVSTCIYTLLNFERDRQMQLINAEREHFGRVYDLLSRFQGKSEAELAAALDAKTKAEFGLVDGLDKYTPSVYTYNKLNAMLRMRERLKNMAPAVNVTLPSEYMKDMMASKSAGLEMIDGQGKVVSRDEFVKNGLSYFRLTDSSYFTWLNDMSGIVPLLTQMEVLSEMYRFERTRNMKPENSVSPKEIITAGLSLLDYTSMNPKEVETIKLLRETGRIPLDQLRRFFLNENYDPEGVLDKTYELLADLNGVFSEGNIMYLTLKGDDKNHGGTDRFLFKPDCYVPDAIESAYVPYVSGSLAIVNQFRNDVLSAASQLKEDRTYVYRLENGQPLLYKPQLLTPVKMNKVNGNYVAFSDSNGGKFNKPPVKTCTAKDAQK